MFSCLRLPGHCHLHRPVYTFRPSAWTGQGHSRRDRCWPEQLQQREQLERTLAAEVVVMEKRLARYGAVSVEQVFSADCQSASDETIFYFSKWVHWVKQRSASRPTRLFSEYSLYFQSSLYKLTCGCTYMENILLDRHVYMSPMPTGDYYISRYGLSTFRRLVASPTPTSAGEFWIQIKILFGLLTMMSVEGAGSVVRHQPHCTWFADVSTQFYFIHGERNGG